MIECNYCHLIKEQDSFRRYKKDPLCTKCFKNEKKLKYRIDNPIKKSCIKCGISKDIKPFVKNTNCCKDCKKLYRREHYDNNKSFYIEYSKERSKLLECKEVQKEYVKNNKDKIKDYQKEYRENNKEVLKEKRKLYNPIRLKRHKERYSNDLKYKISKIHRSILKSFLSRMKKGSKIDTTSKMLGYSYSELKIYIENLFLEGMTWDNHGEWHIDHIKPISLFDIDTPASIVNSLDNLQPLWAIDNLKKSNNYDI